MSTTTTEEERNPGSGTAQGLTDFLSWATEKNYLTAPTGSSLRTGVNKVLEAEADLNAIDIRHADMDDILHRFQNRAKGKLKDRSVEVYESRFRTSVEMYIRFLNKEKDWAPAPSRTRKSTSSGGSVKRQEQATTVVAVGEDATSSAPSSPGVITYPFPIRPGLQGRITLPENLTRREADRISAFIKTLAMEDEIIYEHSPRAITGVVMDDDE